MVVSTTGSSGESNGCTRLVGETRTDHHCIYVCDEYIHAPRVLDQRKPISPSQKETETCI